MPEEHSRKGWVRDVAKAREEAVLHGPVRLHLVGKSGVDRAGGHPRDPTDVVGAGGGGGPPAHAVCAGEAAPPSVAVLTDASGEHG